jgi:hypothetical protein
VGRHKCIDLSAIGTCLVLVVLCIGQWKMSRCMQICLTSPEIDAKSGLLLAVADTIKSIFTKSKNGVALTLGFLMHGMHVHAAPSEVYQALCCAIQ